MFDTQGLVNVFVNPLNVVYFVVLSFILGLPIAWLYKQTNKSVSYSQTFVESLVLLLPVITIIILFISNNIARAIGVFGAFSVVRFRTAVKDSKDMFYIFWVLATGLVIGVGEVSTAFVTTITISMMVYLLKLTGFGRFAKYDYLLIFHLNTKRNSLKEISKALSPLTSRVETLNVQSNKEGDELEVTQAITLKRRVGVESVVNELKKMKGMRNMSLSPAKFELEY